MIRLMKKFFALSTFLSALTFAAIATTSAKAETFATKACDPIQVVIHASYGGGTDTTARMMSIRSRRTLKADMQIVGKRGGSGAKAQNYTLTRPKDGCTIMALNFWGNKIYYTKHFIFRFSNRQTAYRIAVKINICKCF